MQRWQNKYLKTDVLCSDNQYQPHDYTSGYLLVKNKFFNAGKGHALFQIPIRILASFTLRCYLELACYLFSLNTEGQNLRLVSLSSAQLVTRPVALPLRRSAISMATSNERGSSNTNTNFLPHLPSPRYFFPKLS